MTQTLVHRGPDACGLWLDAPAGIGLGHRRLSILDLSPLGRQPMTSACGRYVLCFNGEVFNFARLRPELERLGHGFRGGSDTEVMLAAIVQWGLKDALGRFIGMFAFALWDRRERTLHLVRDRIGIKPLYYGQAGPDFVFGSELKALRAHPGLGQEIDRDALALFFRHNYIPAPHSILRGVRKLLPGHILSIGPGHKPRLDRYWSAEQVYAAAAAAPFSGGAQEAVDELERLLTDAVGLRMLADVPLGAFLSGGIDSSVVVALMQAQSAQPIKTFSIGFAEKNANEAPFALAVARHLGTDHTELYPTAQDMLSIIPELPRHWDEPFADSGQVNAYWISRLARRQVTVALSGDGGDELFLGYDRYRITDSLWSQLARVPRPLRSALASLGQALPAGLFRLLGTLGPKVQPRLDALRSRDFAELYRFLCSHHKDPAGFVLGSSEPPTAFTSSPGGPGLDAFQRMSLVDVLEYLPGDILTKMDRASMAVSLEARVPLLDHRVVEFAASLPSDLKMRDGQSKWPLRQVLYKHVPRHLVDRPKMGFAVPVDQWMRQGLRDWCESLLDEARIRSQGYLDAAAVRTMWREYLAGRTSWFASLWDVLMFQAWLAETGREA